MKQTHGWRRERTRDALPSASCSKRLVARREPKSTNSRMWVIDSWPQITQLIHPILTITWIHSLEGLADICYCCSPSEECDEWCGMSERDDCKPDLFGSKKHNKGLHTERDGENVEMGSEGGKDMDLNLLLSPLLGNSLV
ncbi:hypothetical protein JRQ81_002624 [Phrynocephalus forsythii]|uniref:Uncharacterized protein n=1 Tax=Phrynocephalus forsythii TaxID=171643 RepID=A0A9Q0XIP5_9SAUR|nr:hypothetical protein JRQ81_002624 [Phrynocephalus forsythii]